MEFYYSYRSCMTNHSKTARGDDLSIIFLHVSRHDSFVFLALSTFCCLCTYRNCYLFSTNHQAQHLYVMKKQGVFAISPGKMVRSLYHQAKFSITDDWGVPKVHHQGAKLISPGNSYITGESREPAGITVLAVPAIMVTGDPVVTLPCDFFLRIITSILLLLFRQWLNLDIQVLFDRSFDQYHRLDSVDIWSTSIFFELQNSMRYGCKRGSTEITSVVAICRDNWVGC